MRRLFSGLLIAMATSRPLGAQQAVVLEGGLTTARFRDDSSTAFGPSLRLSVSGRRGRMFGTADGSTLATFGAASVFGSVEGGIRSAHGHRWASELAGELSGVAGSRNSTGAGTALASGRLLHTGESGGGWLRVSAHASGRTNTTLEGTGVDAGGWWTWPRARLTASLAQEWTRAELYTGRFREGYSGTAPVRYTEGTLAVHTEGDRSTFDLVAVVRRDPDAPRVFDTGASASAALWLGRTSAIVFAAGRQLPDWIHGADALDAFTVALRFYQPMPSLERAARLLPVVQVADSAGQRMLRVQAPGARQVEVMADFTEWEAVSLTPRGNVFERAVTLVSGTHRLVVRIDGGAWRTAVNTPAVDDDLGGRVGLLVVP